MAKVWGMLVLATSALMSAASAACVDIDQYLDIPSPMTGDMEINLDGVDTIACVEIQVPGETEPNLLETVIVDGGTLTIKSSSSVRFVDVAFTVATGSNLVFDMPETNFGPNNEGEHRGSYGSVTVMVEEGAGVTFLGHVVAKEITNTRSLFRNSGSMEFKKSVVCQDGGSVFSRNTGVIKFRGDATFKDNRYYSMENEGSGYIRFSKKATFDNNAFNVDGSAGCSLSNGDDAEIRFRGKTTFKNNGCREGPAVRNEGDITFHRKTYFNDNESEASGAGLQNRGGSTTFKAAVQFNSNHADFEFDGGGLAVLGGDVVFNRAVTFDGNNASSGSAFAVEGGSLTFKKPGQVISRNAMLDMYSGDLSCTFGKVSDEGTLIGFTGDDVCVPAEAS